MTDQTAPEASDPAALAAAHFNAAQPYSRIAQWLSGKQPDRAIAAMMVSAGAKKPGKVIKRVSKPLGTLFGTPRVVKWEKGEKFVYGAGFSAATDGDVLEVDGQNPCLFQTDLYLRTREEHTEINAVTVSAVTRAALTALARAQGPIDAASIDKLARQALAAARVFSTGLEAAKITPEDGMEFIVPLGEDALQVHNLPIERTESGEKRMGQILLVHGVIPAAEFTEEISARIGELPVAMTKSGHPGADAFGALVKQNARPRQG